MAYSELIKDFNRLSGRAAHYGCYGRTFRADHCYKNPGELEQVIDIAERVYKNI